MGAAVADRQVHTHWPVAAAVLSASLSIGAHGLAGGGAPTPAHAVLLLTVNAGLGWALAAGLGPRTRASATVALGSALATAQVLGHLVMHSGAHHGSAASLVPDPAMLLCHVAALFAAAVVLAGAQECSHRIGSRIIAVVTGERAIAPGAAHVVEVPLIAPSTRPGLSANPTRGPPATVR